MAIGQAERTGPTQAAPVGTEAVGNTLPGALNLPSPRAFDPPSRRPISRVFASVVDRCHRFCADSFRVEVQFGHMFYWVPVLIGAGAASWFALEATPATTPFAIVCIVSFILRFLLGPWRPVAQSAVTVVCLFALGALLAAWETTRRDTIILDGPVTTTIRGIVSGREIDAAGRWRYEVRLLETEKPRLKRSPVSIRVTALGRGEGLALGQGIEGRARLSPPSGPALPYLNDFSFDAFFDGTGAFGFFYGKPRAWEVAEADRPQQSLAAWALQSLEALRGHIGARIRSILPGDTGAFAASMVTDDRRAMTKETTEALRLAGLAHIIAISGLNMALAAGLFFVGLRMLLSMSQEISHRLPVKKIAAAGALATVTGYYLISGFAVSAERAYIMMAIMLAAVFFGRPSISLRNVALSAIVILILSPSAVMGPGFQMSFSATLALVAGYSAWQRRSETFFPIGGIPFLRRLTPAWNFMAGVFVTSLIGGVSTALYSIEHFHRIAGWGLPANLLAMPVISFVVMPAGLLALILMPLGLDWLPLVVMGWGLDVVIGIAKWAASLGGDWVTGRIPGWFFVGMTIALLVLAIMRSKLRYFGLGLSAMLLLAFSLAPRAKLPDLIIFEDGSLAGIVTGTTLAVSERRPSGFVTDQWQRALRLGTLTKPKYLPAAEDKSKAGKAERVSEADLRAARTAIAEALEAEPHRFICREKHWCAATIAEGRTVVIALNGGYTGIGCDLADIVITPARLKWDGCRSGAALFTGETLRRSGSVELSIGRGASGNSVFRTVGALYGRQRAWTAHRRYDWRTDTFASSD